MGLGSTVVIRLSAGQSNKRRDQTRPSGQAETNLNTQPKGKHDDKGTLQHSISPVMDLEERRESTTQELEALGWKPRASVYQ